MNALNMMIFPLVFCSVVMGICSIGSIKTTGKITGASMVFFLCTTCTRQPCRSDYSKTDSPLEKEFPSKWPLPILQLQI